MAVNSLQEYKKSLRKAAAMAALYVLLILVVLWMLSPVDTALKIIAFVSSTLFFGWAALRDVQRAITKLECKVCGGDLSALLPVDQSVKAKVRFCPLCGSDLP